MLKSLVNQVIRNEPLSFSVSRPKSQQWTEDDLTRVTVLYQRERPCSVCSELTLYYVLGHSKRVCSRQCLHSLDLAF